MYADDIFFWKHKKTVENIIWGNFLKLNFTLCADSFSKSGSKFKIEQQGPISDVFLFFNKGDHVRWKRSNISGNWKEIFTLYFISYQLFPGTPIFLENQKNKNEPRPQRQRGKLFEQPRHLHFYTAPNFPLYLLSLSPQFLQVRKKASQILFFLSTSWKGGSLGENIHILSAHAKNSSTIPETEGWKTTDTHKHTHTHTNTDTHTHRQRLDNQGRHYTIESTAVKISALFFHENKQCVVLRKSSCRENK